MSNSYTWITNRRYLSQLLRQMRLNSTIKVDWVLVESAAKEGFRGGVTYNGVDVLITTLADSFGCTWAREDKKVAFHRTRMVENISPLPARLVGSAGRGGDGVAGSDRRHHRRAGSEEAVSPAVVEQKLCPFCGANTSLAGTTIHADDCWLTLYYHRRERGLHVEAAWNRREWTCKDAASKPSASLADGDIVTNAKWIAGMLDELAAHEGAGPGFRGLGEKVVELAAEYAAMATTSKEKT